LLGSGGPSLRTGCRVGPHFGGPLPAAPAGRALGALAPAENLPPLSGPCGGCSSVVDELLATRAAQYPTAAIVEDGSTEIVVTPTPERAADDRTLCYFRGVVLPTRVQRNA
jgi:hypothetical protein